MTEDRDDKPGERRPGSPQRDHTLRPSGRVDPEESSLPEGPQPTRRTERRTWMAAGALLVVFLIATTAAFIIGNRTNRLAPALIAAAVAGSVGAIPVLLAWWFRRRDHQDLND